MILSAVVALVSFSLTDHGRSRWPALVGVSFGFAVTMVLLFGAVWTRQSWAHYVFVGAVFGSGALFGVFLLFLLGSPIEAHGSGVKLVGIAIACLFSAGTWLVFSRRIRYFTAPPGSGG